MDQNDAAVAEQASTARSSPYVLALRKRLGLFDTKELNTQLDEAHRVLRNVTVLALTTHELHNGLRGDLQSGLQAVDRQLTDAKKQANEVMSVAREMAEVLTLVTMRLDYYEENFDLFKRARRSFNEFIRKAEEKRRQNAQAMRVARSEAPPVDETVARGPQLVTMDEASNIPSLSEMMKRSPLSEGDPIMGTGELVVAPEHNHD